MLGAMRMFWARVLRASLVAAVLAVLWVPAAWAHRSGCHNLHSCPSDSDTYVCGDLGYPCNGATSINDIALEDIAVPLLVEATFEQIFERAPTEVESSYWKRRFRDDKGSLTRIRRAMRWHKAQGSFGPAVQPQALVSKVNALFRAAYGGRNPTVSENQYWVSRIDDKPTEQALQGAMAWHRAHGIEH